MSDEFNPYAAPTTTSMHPRAAEWLQSTDDPSLQKVARGLGLIYTSILVAVGTVILLVVASGFMGGLAAGGGAPANPRDVMARLQIVLVLYGLGLLVAYGMNLTGSFMCLSTPEETGAKGLITTSVTMTVISLVLSVVNFFLENRVVGGIGGLVSVIGGICFLLFLKRLSGFIGAMRLERRAKSILIALVVGVALFILMVVLMVTAGLNAPRGGERGAVAAVGLISVLLVIGGLIVFSMYANLINNLRKAIQSGGSTYV